jgi:basic membrane lipoprotein Med (substrate-binding protein (PBP1-ABC) superfamily)
MKDNVRRQRGRQGLYPGGRMGGQSRLFLSVGIVMLSVAAFSVVSFSITQADDQPLPSMTVGYQNGTITAIHEKTFDIDGRAYGVTQDVVMLDQHGEPLDPGRLIVSAEVKFHVKKEQSNMIDKMIVTLPF